MNTNHNKMPKPQEETVKQPRVHNKYHNTASNDAVYIGRGSKWGNPFVIGKDGNRQEVIEKYKEYILGNASLLADLHEIKNKDLVCFCAPQPCHGDVLIFLANNNQKGTDMEKFIVFEHHTEEVFVVHDNWGNPYIVDKNEEIVPMTDIYKDIRQATRHAEELIKAGKTAFVISTNKKGKIMKIYRVTDYSTGEVFEIEAESAFKAGEAFRKEGKAIKVESTNNTQEGDSAVMYELFYDLGWFPIICKEHLIETYESSNSGLTKKEWAEQRQVKKIFTDKPCEFCTQDAETQTTQEETVKKATPTPSAALDKLEKLTPEEIAEITALLEKNILPHLKSDVSNYAKGRQRVWLPYQAPLGNQPFVPELMDDEVWQWIVDRCAKHGFKAQVALISKGGNINPHRDTTFAAPWAMGFNLGKCDWHIAENFDDLFDWDDNGSLKTGPRYNQKEEIVGEWAIPFSMNLNGGEVFMFNSKHTHAVTNAAPDRWSINVWAIANGPAANRANIARRLEQMLEKHPEVQEFIEVHQPGATTTKSKKEDTTMAEKPKYHIAFTGHRPHKLPDKATGYDPTNPTRVAVRAAIREALQRAIDKYGKTHEIVAITGGALGVDQDAASIAHKLGLPFIVAAPCQGQDSKWPAASKARYKTMLGFAAEVVVIHDGPYNNTCMQDRNEWMVDHCDALIAVWDGSSGGTANCVKYAKKKKKPIVYINPDNPNGGEGNSNPTPNNPEEGPTMKNEASFKGTFLSNFWPATVMHGGIVFPTVENFYQAMKVDKTDMNTRRQFQSISPAEAKKKGKQIQKRKDWTNNMALEVMLYGLRAKFAEGSELAEKLLATGEQELIETNYWHDTFWGKCTCTNHAGNGENKLGILLMQVREELKNNGGGEEQPKPIDPKEGPTMKAEQTLPNAENTTAYTKDYYWSYQGQTQEEFKEINKRMYDEGVRFVLILKYSDFYQIHSDGSASLWKGECPSGLIDELSKDDDDTDGDGGVFSIDPTPTDDNGGGGEISPVPTHEEEIMESSPDNNSIIEKMKELVEQHIAQENKFSETTNKTPKEGNNMIKEYLVETMLLSDRQQKLYAADEKMVPSYSVGRVITNDPEYWFKKDDTTVLEEVDRGDYHFALLEHLFGDKSFIVNITGWTDPTSKEPHKVLMSKSGGKPAMDSIFGWADFDSETFIRVKDHGNKGWSDLSEYGLHVGNSSKMTKRLVELTKSVRGYAIHKRNDSRLRIKVLTYEQMLKAFPYLKTEEKAGKPADGVSMLAVETAKYVYRRNNKASKSSKARILHDIDNKKITNHTLRILTNLNGAGMLVKGNALTAPRSQMNARMVELGFISDGEIYDVFTSVDNCKTEFGTDGSFEIVTLEPHHKPGLVKTNDQTMSKFMGIPGMFDPKELLETFQVVLDKAYNNMVEGKDIEFLENISPLKPRTEAEKIAEIMSSKVTNQVNKMAATLKALDLPIGVSQTLMLQRANLMTKMFLSETAPVGKNWMAPSREKKSFLFMPWAYRAYIMSKEMVYMLGYDVDLDNMEAQYHAETQTIMVPGLLYDEIMAKLGGGDADDEVMVHIRKMICKDGSVRLVAVLIRTPDDWAEYWTIDVDIENMGPVFLADDDDIDLPTIYEKDFDKFKVSSVCGQLPSAVNGSDRPNPETWNWDSTYYNFKAGYHHKGQSVGGQVKTKMLYYSTFNKPFDNLPCANEDMIDALQQCKGTIEDLMELNEWASMATAEMLVTAKLDAYWWHSRNMKGTVKALVEGGYITDALGSLAPYESPIVTELMVPRENMVRETYSKMLHWLNNNIMEIPELNICIHKQNEMKFRKLVTELNNMFLIPESEMVDQYGRKVKMTKAQRSEHFEKAAKAVADRFASYKERLNDDVQFNKFILSLVRMSWIRKTEAIAKNYDMKNPRHNYDRWLYTAVSDADTIITDYFFEAMLWFRETYKKKS